MDLSKDSDFFKMYGECWNLFKKYSKPSRWEDMETYLREARELKAKYPQFHCYLDACLVHYGRMIENEYKERLV